MNANTIYGTEPTPELKDLIEQLNCNDWRLIGQLTDALVSKESEGIQAIIWGLGHPNTRIRRRCADIMDHHGTDECTVPLHHAALHDPVPAIRRAAVHSASCQRCKQCPLTGDLVGFLTQVALSDPSRRVREEAIFGLSYQPGDTRAITVLESILRTETNERLRRVAHHALKHQSPDYRAMVDAQARARGIEAARTRVQAES